jgi:ABC-type transport system involved in multi-copper enzyme maturation permease subunit
MNPVWKRELRARWRGRLAFALVFLYVAVLASVFVWQYGANANQNSQAFFDPLRRLSLLGHDLFVLLAWLQVALWMLLAPVLTATSITGEREKGLLESLHLSRLRAREIVSGKLCSALSFVALMIVITLPISATCFLMGGVSPAEFLLVLALHTTTAICCASIGLAISSWCKTGMAAIVLSIVAVATWCGLAYVAAIGAFTGFNPSATPLPWPQPEILELFFKAHPVTAILEVIGVFDVSKGFSWKTTSPSWIVSLIFLSALTLVNLWIASKGARRLLFDNRRIEWQRLRRDLKTPDATNLATNLAAHSGSTPGLAATPDPKTRRFEFGFLARWRFSNPVLGREVRSCFRPRSTSLAMLVIAGVLLPMAAVAYMQGLYWALFDEKMRVVIGPSLLVIYLMMAIVLCGVLGAGGLARERDGATWEALKLSLLSPREILWGKMGTPLLMFAFCGAVFLPILLPCVRGLGVLQAAQRGISFSQLVAAHLLIVSVAWFCALLGLTFSHFSRKPATAICWTLGTLFVSLVAAPVFWQQVGRDYSAQRDVEQWLAKWHPVAAMANLFGGANIGYSSSAQTGSTLGLAWPCALVFFALGAVLYVFLLRELAASRQAHH